MGNRGGQDINGRGNIMELERSLPSCQPSDGIRVGLNTQNCRIYLSMAASEDFLQLHQAGATLLLWCAGFSFWWLLFLQSTSSRRADFSSHSTQAYLLCVMWDFSGSEIRPMFSCIGRWISNHWTTRKTQLIIIFSFLIWKFNTVTVSLRLC